MVRLYNLPNFVSDVIIKYLEIISKLTLSKKYEKGTWHTCGHNNSQYTDRLKN